VPRPRSWACEHRERSPCELDTIALRRSPSGTLEIATPIGPCLAELDHCRNGLTLSPGVFCRSRRVSFDADGQVIIRRQLKRRYVLAFFENLAPCLIGIEACASSHH
jgi:hypothetical protein